MRITLKNISEYCLLSMDDERKLKKLLDITNDCDLVQAMANMILNSAYCYCHCEACKNCSRVC